MRTLYGSFAGFLLGVMTCNIVEGNPYLLDFDAVLTNYYTLALAFFFSLIGWGFAAFPQHGLNAPSLLCIFFVFVLFFNFEWGAFFLIICLSFVVIRHNKKDSTNGV